MKTKLNLDQIKGLGFVEDVTFKYSEHLLPYLEDLNSFTFKKLKTANENFNMYFDEDAEWNILLETAQYNNIFTFRITTLNELNILLRQTGLDIYLDYAYFSKFKL